MKGFRNWLFGMRPFYRFLVLFIIMQASYIISSLVFEAIWGEPEKWHRLLLGGMITSGLFSFLFIIGDKPKQNSK
jgi:hypothetical protein